MKDKFDADGWFKYEKWWSILDLIARKSYNEVCKSLKLYYIAKGKGKVTRYKLPPGLNNRLAEWRDFCDFLEIDLKYLVKISNLPVLHFIVGCLF